MENLPDARALIHMGREMVRFYCQSFAPAPRAGSCSISTIPLTRCMANSSCACSMRSTTRADSSGHCCARPAAPRGAENATHIRRLILQIAGYWPKTEILLRVDSHYCTPEVLDLCDRRGLRYIFGLSKNGRPAQNISALEASTAARYARTPGPKLRWFKTFSYAARSWSKSRRVIARVEVGPMGRDTCYIITNLEGRRGNHLYERLYSVRGQAENHIKAWKTNLASDRTSCSKANANQMRLMLHSRAYWLWWKLRATCAKRSLWRRAQFDTLRLHLVKLAATIVEKKTRIIITLPKSCPRQGPVNLLFEALAPPKVA